jgi:hypothetical protein
MRLFDSLFRLLKLWQFITLVIATVVSAGIAYAVYTNLSGASDSALPQTQQLYPVQYGDLTNKVSTNGSLFFPNKEILIFGTQGTVSEVFVKEGDKVARGQSIATLGDADIALLENAVSQAKVKLREAQDDLEASGRARLTGTLEDIEANVITVNTPQGLPDVTVSGQTTIVISNLGNVSDLNVRIGDTVIVTGQRVEDGSVIAQSVTVTP